MAVVEALSSEFDYFSPMVVSDHLLDAYTVAIPPKAAPQRGQPIEFSISGNPEVYRDLNNSLLEVKCKVTNDDKTALAATAAVAPVNLLLHALFKSCEVSVNGTLVSDSSSHYAERAYLETLLSAEERVLKTRGVLEGWAKDDAEQMDALILAAADNKVPNSGFVTRNKLCAGSRVMTLVGRPHADLFHQPLDIPGGVNIDIKFEQNDDKKVLMAANNAAFKLELISARLLIHSKKPKPDLIYAHQLMAEKSNYKIPYIKVSTRVSTVSAGSTSMDLNDFISGPMPNRVTLCLISSNAHDGAYNENPFKFGNFGLTALSLKVGEQRVPHEDMKMNYTQGDYAIAYLNTLTSLGIDQGDKALSITPAEWASAYNIYSFKLAPGDISTGVVNSATTKTVKISVSGKFSAALTGNVAVLAYIERPDLLEIDHLNNVVG